MVAGEELLGNYSIRNSYTVDRRQMPQLCEIDEKCHVLHMCYNVLQCATMCYIFESKIRYCVIGNQCRIGRHMPPPPDNRG